MSRDEDVLIPLGNAFHSFGAVAENDPSYRAVLDLGTDKEPHVTGRKLRLWVSDTGFNKSLMYSGVRLFIALWLTPLYCSHDDLEGLPVQASRSY